MKDKRFFSTKNNNINKISQNEQIKKHHYEDEQREKLFEKEKHKYTMMIDELRSRLKEIHNILMHIKPNSLMTLYLICLHHELYLKSNLEVESIKEILRDVKKGHDIKYLLSKIPEKKGELIKMIEDDCKKVIDISPRLGEIKNYPDFRYNFSRFCLDNKDDHNVILCDLTKHGRVIENMRKSILERFSKGFQYD